METTQVESKWEKYPDEPRASRSVLYADGHKDGVAAAVNDYMNRKVNLDIFDQAKTFPEYGDYYLLGFEMGYLRKLAEIGLM